ncbi:MAG: type VI secretion system protein TssA [Cellvibrionaceae bacterium]|nr:type VI secretion system protein TssA [Cellvibrionaceae bacterium]
MASLISIDLDALLAPISDDMPTGKDCRQSSSPNSFYQQVKTARNSARETERKNAAGADLGSPDEDWRKVADLAPKILTQESKDLEVACWYLEALLRRYSFRGLRDGLMLLDGMIERYWENLYPTPDEDGLETKVAPITGLNGTGQEGVLISAIRTSLITQGNSRGPFAFWECQKALTSNRIQDSDNREKEFKKLGFEFEDMEKAVQESSAEFMTNLRDDLIDSIALYRQISGRLDEYCGTYDAPPTSLVISLLEECLGVVKHLGQNKFPAVEIITTDDSIATDAGASSAASPAPRSAGGPLETREQAFNQMLEIAEFFRKREPHSPISYVLEKAVKWGNMPLFDLMRELISDDKTLEEYGKLTGVKTEE